MLRNETLSMTIITCSQPPAGHVVLMGCVHSTDLYTAIMTFGPNIMNIFVDVFMSDLTNVVHIVIILFQVTCSLVYLSYLTGSWQP